MENHLKYFIHTFGCQMNISDAERISAVLEKIGYSPASNEKEADLIVAVMCSVRQSAVDRIFGMAKNISEIKIKNPNLKTVLTGCILPEDFKKSVKIFDYILPIKKLSQWPEMLREENQYQAIDRMETDCSYLAIKPKYKDNFSVSIPISNGCDNFCTYCAVPYTRGKLVSRSHKAILEEAENAIKNGAKEIWLLGQNVNDYNWKGINFAKLLEMVNALEGSFWIRFTSPHPKNFSDATIETIARCRKIAPYLSLPLQSGSNEVLRRMNRPYTVNDYNAIVKRIRKSFKSQRPGLEGDPALATDIIVGYPGEIKKQFEETAKMMSDIKYDMAYIAQYSPRPGTRAAYIPDNVAKAEKQKRWEKLTEILERTALDRNKIFVGHAVEVLIKEQRKDVILGKSRHFKTVKIKIPQDLEGKKFIGKFVKAEINKALPWGLEGELVK